MLSSDQPSSDYHHPLHPFTLALSPLQEWHMTKSKNRKTDVKMGHSTHAAYLMHISLEYSLKAFVTQLFTAKRKYTQKENSKAFIENPGMQCLRCVVVEREHRKPFLHYFLSFSDSLVL